jgi:hypothetical protein
MSFDTVIFYSTSNLNYAEINETFLTGEDKDFLLSTFSVTKCKSVCYQRQLTATH